MKEKERGNWWKERERTGQKQREVVERESAIVAWRTGGRERELVEREGINT
jgi:hypothetical protein